jgi:hypothetical protein
LTSQIDDTLPVYGNPTTASVRANFATAKQEISALQAATTGGPFLPLAGGHLTGPMYLWNDPTDGRMPATKDYVDAHAGSGGGTGIPEAPADGKTYGRNSGAWVAALPLAGGTLTGALLLAADPAAPLGAATKQYVDVAGALAAGAVQKAGDTMTGLLTLSGDPTSALHAATRRYVDGTAALLAPLASPAFTGTPTAPTAAAATNTTQIATTAFVKAQAYVSGGPYLPLAGGTLSGALALSGGDVTLASGNLRLGAANATIGIAGFTILQGAEQSSGGYTTIFDNSGNGALLLGSALNLHRQTEHVFQGRTGSPQFADFQAAGTYNASGAWIVQSDRELKQDIAPYTRGLDAILALSPVMFRYAPGAAFAAPDAPTLLGLIADEVEPHMPELVGEFTDTDGGTVATLAPGNLVYALVNAVKELAPLVKDLAARVDAIEAGA